MTTHDDPIRTALRAHLDDETADALLAKAGGFSNLPNTVKGLAKSTGAPRTEAAALAAVEGPELAGLLDELSNGRADFADRQRFWGLLTLAARAELAVLDRMADRFDGQDYAPKLLATIRRAATKHATAAPVSSTAGGDVDATGPQVPQKVSEVKAWLAAHPGVDPAVLAPQKGQKAGARAAAVRALGAMGTPDALAVLGQYADERYPDAVLKELHQAWTRFDRREFAATMFRSSATLDLGVAASLEGIGAVPDLTGLEVILTGKADLAPLAECVALRTLRVAAEGPPGLLGVEPLLELPELTELHLTRMTRNADLTPLADLGVRRLRIDLDGADGSFLLRMPRLERLLLATGEAADVPVVATEQERGALAEVVLALVRKGVRVVVYRHERAWVAGLLDRAEAAPDVHTVEASGYLGLTADGSALEQFRRHLGSNLVP